MKVSIIFKRPAMISDKKVKEVDWEVSNMDFCNNLFSFVVEPKKQLLFIPKKIVKYLTVGK